MFIAVVTYESIKAKAWNHDHKIYFVDKSNNSFPCRVTPSVQLLPQSWQDLIYVFPIFGVSFLCHFNIPQIHAEVTRPSRKRVRKILHATVLICCVVYSIVGSFGYIWAYDYTCGNILLNYQKDNILVTLGRLGLGMTVSLSFPLLILPGRASLHILLNKLPFCNCKGMNLHDGSSKAQNQDEKNKQATIRRANIHPRDKSNNNNNSNSNSNKYSTMEKSETDEERFSLRQNADYFNPDNETGTEPEDTPQQSLQPIDGSIKNKNEKIYMKTRSASPQITSSHPRGNMNKYNTNQNNNNTSNIYNTTDDIMAPVHGSLNSPPRTHRPRGQQNGSASNRNIQVLDRRAQMYEQKLKVCYLVFQLCFFYFVFFVCFESRKDNQCYNNCVYIPRVNI